MRRPSPAGDLFGRGCRLSGMTVSIPSPLRSYTGGTHIVEGHGTTLAEVLADLNERYPGLRFRIVTEQDGIRRHIKIFINEELVRDLADKVQDSDTIHIICALSGG